MVEISSNTQLNLLISDNNNAKEYWDIKIKSYLEHSCETFDRIYQKAEKIYQKFELDVPQDVYTILNEKSKGIESRLFVFVVSAIGILYHKMYLHDYVSFGIPTLNNNGLRNESINDYIFLELRFEENVTIKDILAFTQQEIVNSFDNQKFPLHHYFNFVVNNNCGDKKTPFSIVITSSPMHDTFDIQKYQPDILFKFKSRNKNLKIEVDFNIDRYTISQIEILTKVLINILKSINNFQIPINIIPLVNEKEKEAILKFSCGEEKDFPIVKGFIPQFEETVLGFTNRIAVISNHEKISYLELNNKANACANYLLSKGLKPKTLIAIYLNRSIDLIAAIIGVLKSGNPFILLDTNLTPKRITNILNLCNAEVLLCRDIEYKEFKNLPYELIISVKILKSEQAFDYSNQRNPEVKITPDSLAYVIYTSGTTGDPKGVMINHSGMLNHLYGMIDFFALNHESVLAQTADCSFDISIWQLLACSLIGGTTIVISKAELLDINMFFSLLNEYKITIAELVPSYMNAMLDFIESDKKIGFANLKWMLVTGEVVPVKIAFTWYKYFPNIQLVNAYGPAEASDDVSLYIISKENRYNKIPIGKPLPNIHLYIMDNYQNLMPIGSEGEICVSGICLSSGYLNDEKKTKDIFVDNPLFKTVQKEEYRKLYRTGDTGRWDINGNLEFLGRIDNQVKIRGSRVELGEVENHILKIDGIKEAVVLDTEKNGEKSLCAYYVLKPRSNCTHIKLKEILQCSLPYYMQPSFYIQLKEIPKSKNGKIDKNKLRRFENNILFEHHKDVIWDLFKDQGIEQTNILFSSEKPDKLKNKNSIAHVTIQILRNAESNPDKVIIKNNGQSITYFQLLSMAHKYKALIINLIPKNGKVGILVDNSIETIAASLAVVLSKASLVPINYIDENEYKRKITYHNLKLILGRSDKFSNSEFSILQGLEQNPCDYVKTSPRKSIEKLDLLPIVDRSLIDYSNYNKYIGIAMARNTVLVQTSRGCPFRCAFCHKIWSKKHIIRNYKNVLEEIEYCFKYGVRKFVFIDDIFGFDKNNSTKILEEIISKKLNIQLFFPNGLRGDILTKSFIDLMVEAGTVNIDLALETPVPRLQKILRKHLNINKFSENVCYILENYPQILFEMEVMVGIPTETEEEALKTINYIKSLKWIDFINYNILKIYPNSEMYDIAIENGISQESIYGSLNLSYHELPNTLPFSKEFMRMLQSKYFNEYFLSKERLTNVLPYQTKVFSENELSQKYNSYVPQQISCFNDILNLADIKESELVKEVKLLQDNPYVFNFPKHKSITVSNHKKLLKVLLVDIGLLELVSERLYNVIDEPLGLMCLLTSLNNSFKECLEGKIVKTGIDFQNTQQLRDIITDFRPEIIGIRALSAYKDLFHLIAGAIKQISNVLIIAGGPYVTSSYKTAINDENIDIIVLGEGEETFIEFVQAYISNGKSLPDTNILSRIEGIVFRNDKLHSCSNVNIVLTDLLDIENSTESTEKAVFTVQNKIFADDIENNQFLNVIKNHFEIESAFVFNSNLIQLFNGLYHASELVFVNNKNLEKKYKYLTVIKNTDNHSLTIDRLTMCSLNDDLDLIQSKHVPKNNQEEVLKNIWHEILRLDIDLIPLDKSFFELGGNSLLVIMISHRINMEFKVDFPMSEIFKRPTIELQAEYITQNQGSTKCVFKKSEKKEYYNLSNIQERYYLFSNNELLASAFIISEMFVLKKEFNIDLFNTAINMLVKKYEILRTVFVSLNNTPYQMILDERDVKYKIEVFELEKNRREDIIRFLNDDKTKYIFDLKKWPLFKLCCIKDDKDNYVVAFSIHHIIIDAVSLNILFNELFEIYFHLIESKNSNSFEPKFQYRDYSEWLNSLIKNNRLTNHKEYWLSKLENMITDQILPYDFNRDFINSIESYERVETFDKIKITSLIDINELDSSLFMIFISLINILFYKISNAKEIIIGTAISNSILAGFDNSIGCFLNTLPIKTIINENDNFLATHQKIKEVILEAFDHKIYPFNLIVDNLKLERRKLQNPLFDVFFNLINKELNEYNHKFSDLFKTIENNDPRAHIDLNITCIEKIDTVRVSFTFNSKLFIKDTMDYIFNQFVELINVLQDSKYLPIKDLVIEEETKSSIINTR